MKGEEQQRHEQAPGDPCVGAKAANMDTVACCNSENCIVNTSWIIQYKGNPVTKEKPK